MRVNLGNNCQLLSWLTFLALAIGSDAQIIKIGMGSVPIGGACTASNDCHGFPDKTVCNMAKICICRDDHVLVESELGFSCEPVRNELGEGCISRVQCTAGVPGEWSDCLPNNFNLETKVCKCSEGSFNQLGKHKCLANAEQIDDPCETHEQCRHGLGDFSRCQNNKCECIPNISFPNLNNTKCLLIMNLIGGPCESHEQCRLGVPGELSECVVTDENLQEKICQCQENAIPAPNRHICFQKAERIGDTCEFSGQCTANLGDRAICTADSMTCQCLGGSPAQGDTCSVVQNELGGNCTQNSDCQQGLPGELSICLEGKCACNSNATNEPGENVCRRRATHVGDECVRNAQCKANLGELSECQLEEGCVCTPRYGVPSLAGDRCLPVINFIGGECTERQQCTAGTPRRHSDCLESPFIPGIKICNCSSGAEHEPGRHECLKEAVLIGNLCETDEQCVGEPGINSVCSGITNRCGCLGGYVPSLANDNCLPILNRLGESCLLSEQCQLGIPGRLSACTSEAGVCDCSSGSVNELGQHYCHPIAVYGDTCQVNVQCTASLGEYSHCVARACECTKNASPDLSKKKCILNQ